MKKNVASQVIGAQMVNASTGAAFTGSVTVYVTGDGGTQAVGSVGSGACTHEGNGYHTYAPAQAETNYDLVAFTFTGTGAVPVTVQVYTTFPQTGDNYARLGAPAGASVSADIAAVKSETATILTDTNELQGDWTNGGRLDLIIDAILVDTGTTLETHLTDIKGATFSGATDSLEAIRDRGDAAWTTATGFSTIDAAGVRTAVGLASANLDTQLSTITADTNELQTDWANGGRLDLIVDAILVDTAEIGAAGAGLTNLGGMSTTMKAEVNAEMVDVIATDTYAEPGQGAPAATASLAAKINYLYKNWRNKRTQTATTESLYDDAGTTVDQKRTVSDDGTTATKGEMGTGP